MAFPNINVIYPHDDDNDVQSFIIPAGAPTGNVIDPDLSRHRVLDPNPVDHEGWCHFRCCVVGRQLVRICKARFRHTPGTCLSLINKQVEIRLAPANETEEWYTYWTDSNQFFKLTEIARWGESRGLIRRPDPISAEDIRILVDTGNLPPQDLHSRMRREMGLPWVQPTQVPAAMGEARPFTGRHRAQAPLQQPQPLPAGFQAGAQGRRTTRDGFTGADGAARNRQRLQANRARRGRPKGSKRAADTLQRAEQRPVKRARPSSSHMAPPAVGPQLGELAPQGLAGPSAIATPAESVSTATHPVVAPQDHLPPQQPWEMLEDPANWGIEMPLASVDWPETQFGNEGGHSLFPLHAGWNEASEMAELADPGLENAFPGLEDAFNWESSAWWTMGNDYEGPYLGGSLDEQWGDLLGDGL